MHRESQLGHDADAVAALKQNTCPHGAASLTNNPGNDPGVVGNVRIIAGILDHYRLGVIIGPSAFLDSHRVPKISGKPHRHCGLPATGQPRPQRGAGRRGSRCTGAESSAQGLSLPSFRQLGPHWSVRAQSTPAIFSQERQFNNTSALYANGGDRPLATGTRLEPRSAGDRSGLCVLPALIWKNAPDKGRQPVVRPHRRNVARPGKTGTRPPESPDRPGPPATSENVGVCQGAPDCGS